MNTIRTSQYWLEQKDPKNQLIITNGTEGGTVKASLPEEYGLTVGSEFSTPFDVNSFSQRVQQLMAVTSSGIGQKAGFKMRRYYTNPELSEISFDIELIAYYSCVHEVLLPVYKLMKMSVGRDVNWETFKHAEEQLIR